MNNNAQWLGALARFMIMISFLDLMLAMLWPTAWEAEPLASPISGNKL